MCTTSTTAPQCGTILRRLTLSVLDHWTGLCPMSKTQTTGACVLVEGVSRGCSPHGMPSLHRYIPFSGGPRKCVGDQFALMEAVVALAVILRGFDFEMVPGKVRG